MPNLTPDYYSGLITYVVTSTLINITHLYGVPRTTLYISTYGIFWKH